MSNPGLNKKQPSKNAHSYLSLLKGLNDSVKTKVAKNTSSSKKSSNADASESSLRKTKDNQKPSSTPEMEETETEQDPNIPDRSYGDYFCKICDSHMNSDNMWEAHVTGKRHLKNVKKGDTDSKYDDLPDVESNISNELKNVKDEPIVGLSYIHEIRRKEENVPPIFNCFLCHSSLATIPLVIEHVISLKHRLNYVKENNPEEYSLIEATNLKKGVMEPLVVEAARRMEEKCGRGTVRVKQEKKKTYEPQTYSAKKSFNPDFDDRYQESRLNSKFEDTSSHWKSVDASKHYRQEERSRSPIDFDKKFNRHTRSRSPKDFNERKWTSYFDEDNSMDDRRSFSKRRNISPREEASERNGSFSSRRVISLDDYERHESKRDSPDDFERPRSSSKRAISPPSYNDYERHRSLSKRAISPPSYNDYERHRSLSKRAISPPRNDDYERPRSFSKKDASPRRDEYLSRITDKYSRPSGKSDSQDVLNYISEPSTSRGPVKKTFNNFVGPRKLISVENPSQQNDFLPVQNPIAIARPFEPKSWEAVYKDTLLLKPEDCYKLFYNRLAALPATTSLEEVILLSKLSVEVRKKLNDDLPKQVLDAVVSIGTSANSTSIPGLDNAMSSSARPQTARNENSSFMDASSFINEILKSANLSPVQSKSSASQNQLPLSYHRQPFQDLYASSQPGALVNSYQTQSANRYQGQPVSSFPNVAAASSQPVSSYPNMAASSSQPVSSYPNMGGPSNQPVSSFPNMGGPSSQPAQVYNYLNYPSSSSAPKNHPRKY